MSERQHPRDKLRELASRLNLQIDDVLEELQSAGAVPATPPPPPSEIPLSDGAIRAAIRDTFTAHDPWAKDLDPSVLERSQLVMIDGKRRLRLSESARGAILRAASAAGDRLASLLAEPEEQPAHQVSRRASDATSQALRAILRGETVNLAGAPPPVLRATVAALERLKEAPLPAGTPPLEEAQRLLERAELLEPLRMMIGATGSWDSQPETDRFAGRTTELRDLRAFVDELESESAFERIQRNLNAAQKAVEHSLGFTKAEGVRLIVARGGLGKSTLIAKFVLDHALSKGRPFPFAYLDFDRASIQARDPRQLLLEVVRQVELQFPVAADELRPLRQHIKQSLTAMRTRLAIDADPFEEFRRIMDGRITRGKRALLIVLDTVEMVQSDSHAMTGLLAFLDRLSQGGFTELRIVAAGRAEVPELVAESHARRAGMVIALPPLTHPQAIQMVQLLGRSLLPDEWREHWTSQLAGRPTDVAERREPLSLRVAVETIRDEQPSKRDEAAVKIRELGEDGKNFVGKLYMNRVVGHVTGGDDVRKLAWPGLVMRKITPDIIRHALAPVLDISANAAEALFDALGTQLWIVSKNGTVLTHEPDLRARTLPLMRQMDRFADINAAAIKYHGERHGESEQHRAEWLYHRLLGREAPQRVDRDWHDAVVPLLKGAASDFPRGGPESDYLSVRTSDQLQPNDVLNRVEPRLALLHVSRVGAAKGSLGDAAFDPLLLTLPIDVIPPSALPREAEAARFTLMVKTGRWNVGSATRSDEGPWQTLAATANAYRRARVGEAASLAEELGRTYFADTSVRSAAAPIQDLATARLAHWREAERLDGLVHSHLSNRSWRADLTVGSGVLRTAMAFGERSTAVAARLWATQAMEVVRANASGAVSSQELKALLPDDHLEKVVRTVLTGAKQTWDAYLAQTHQETDRTRLSDQALAVAIIDAVLRRAERGEPDDLDRLRRFAAARDEDWVMPMAYAAHRATNGRVPPSIAKLFETHYPRERGFLERTVARDPQPADIMAVFRRADEASDIESAARLFLEDGDPTMADDLRRLLTFYRGWKGAMREMIKA